MLHVKRMSQQPRDLKTCGIIPAALAGIAFIVIAGGGLGEETAFRGFLFDRLGKMLGHGVPAKICIVLITSAVFAAFHFLDQGIAGVEQAVFTGLIFGSIS
jgi:membrane protease YdiL (CAAX protease family)